jgi:hypothetical protein
MKQHPLKIVKKTLANKMLKNLNKGKVKSCEMKCEFQSMEGASKEAWRSFWKKCIKIPWVV